MSKETETKIIILSLGFVLIPVLIYKSDTFNFNLLLDNYKNSLEIENILKNTPNLWRQLTFSPNVTVASRIKSQRLWIQRISSTDFIKNSKTKKILLQDISSVFNYYFTDNKVKCPYARNFENKCELIEENSKPEFKDDFKYEGIDASVGIRLGGLQFEEILPKGIQQIFYILEPPHHAKYAHLGANNALLASYWRGSDIPIPYGEWSPIMKPVQHKSHSNKTKLVAALISNCDREQVMNNRLGYIKELNKYIQVDFYGRCGDLECPKDCLRMLGDNYKFYLSFENGNCEDYITEKFFINALSHNMVPIVMGSQPESYKSASPPNSYIHVDDFESPKALAEYLHLLDKNDDLYQEYFEWKSTGQITHKALEDFFCRVCGMLFYADFIPPPSWESERTLFSDVNKCLPRDQWNWT